MGFMILQRFFQVPIVFGYPHAASFKRQAIIWTNVDNDAFTLDCSLGIHELTPGAHFTNVDQL